MELPCGHEAPLFDMQFIHGGESLSIGKHPIAHPARSTGFGSLPPTAWCSRGHGWVDISHELYDDIEDTKALAKAAALTQKDQK